MAIQQLTLGVGASKKTYLDDVFSTFLYKGTSGSNTINNGVDLSGEGGLLWIKARDSARSNQLFDTARGVNTRMQSNGTGASVADSGMNQSFTSTGFGFNNSYTDLNSSSVNYSSWSFRKAPGFFDVVTYTGNGTARTIAHSLGSVPGMIMIKNLDSAENWRVYHKSLGATNRLILNSDSAAGTTSTPFNDTAPTASVFSVGTDGATNNNGDEFVAYVFAGGESTAATARSVEFDGTGDWLTTSTSSDYDLGTGDFTFECWVKWDTNASNLVVADHRTSTDSSEWVVYVDQDAIIFNCDSSDRMTTGAISRNVWYHVAIVRSTSGITRMYVDGDYIGNYANQSINFDNTVMRIGGAYSNNYGFDGKISNVRLVKGTAVYTSSFRPPTEPLTNITNTKLLCCQNSTVNGATVGTVTEAGNPTASIDSPFDDPAGFKFGENGDQNVIKCGSYVGNGSSTGPEIDLGWEPQWIMIKRATGGTENWAILDTMRGWTNGVADTWLRANTNDDEETGADGRADLISTGFKLNSSNAEFNSDGDTYIYMAIRRPDGYVGKPPELGTSVFNIANYDSTAPAFNANFAVDFAMFRRTNSSYDWRTSARLIQTKYLKTNNTDTDSTENDYVFDYNDGWNKQTGYANNEVSWMWARGAGMDVVTYAGVASTYSASGVGSISVPHSLNAVPEMIWVKNRTYEDANGWAVYHKGLNGGTNPEQYRMRLQDTNAEDDNVGAWQDTAPTSTHFTLGTDRMVNQSPNNYLAILFTSVNGISKVGYYTGDSSQVVTIETGFQPRFIIMKRTDSTSSWYVLDTTRGWATLAGDNDKLLMLNNDTAQSDYEFGDPVSNGFRLNGNVLGNQTDSKWIYYAHA